MFCTGKGRVSCLTGCLVILFCLAWGGALERAEGATDAQPTYVISICIMPFYTSTSRANWDSDLAPLLEADLAAQPWLKLIPTNTTPGS